MLIRLNFSLSLWWTGQTCHILVFTRKATGLPQIAYVALVYASQNRRFRSFTNVNISYLKVPLRCFPELGFPQTAPAHFSVISPVMLSFLLWIWYVPSRLSSFPLQRIRKVIYSPSVLPCDLHCVSRYYAKESLVEVLSRHVPWQGFGWTRLSRKNCQQLCETTVKL